MRFSRVFIIVSFLFFNITAQSQDLKKLGDSLYNVAIKSKTDSGYVMNLLMASNMVFETNKPQSLQFMNTAMLRADESRNSKLITEAYVYASYIYSSRSNIAANLDTALNYAQKSFDIASNSNIPTSLGWANLALARIYRSKDQREKALQYNQTALMLATNSKDDSLLVTAHVGLGNTLLEKSQKLDAFRNFMTALDIADQSGRSGLLTICYRKLSDFYAGIQQYEKSKDYLFRLLKLYKDEKAPLVQVVMIYGTIASRNISAKQYDLAEAYLDSAMAMCDNAKLPMIKLNLLDPLLTLYFSSNNPQKIFTLFKEKKEMIDLMKSIGYTSPIDFLTGAAYADMNVFDSAHHYYRKSAPFYLTQAASSNKQFFLKAYGDLYKKEQRWDSAIQFYQQVFEYAKQVGSLEMQKEISKELDSVYQRSGNFEKAYTFAGIYSQLNDTLQQLSKEKDLLSVEVENENKRKERELLKQQEEQARRHNIQYMGITIAIAAIFLLLTLMGLFKISKGTIKTIGFFAFIFLFEFIILLADNQIHHWTHGEPWKIILIKIGLIAILLPLHHWLEEKVIHYLTNKDLLSHSKFRLLKRNKTATPE